MTPQPSHPISDAVSDDGETRHGDFAAWRISLTLSLAAYFILQFFWITVTPLREQSLPNSLPNHSTKPILLGTGPDESEHFLYILSVANNGQLPPPTIEWRRSAAEYVSHEGQHPPLFYIIAAGIYKLFRPLGESAVWYALRIFGTMLGAVTIVVISIAAQKAFPDRPFIGLATPPFLAFLPIFSYMTATLSNLPLEMVITSVAWLLLVEIVRGKRTLDLRSGLILGALFGVALIVRVTTLLWAPAVAMILIWAAMRTPSVGTTRAFGGVVVCALVAGICLAPWLIHMKATYGAMFFRSDYRPLLYNDSLWHWITNPDEKVQVFGTEHFMSMPPRTIALWYCSTSWLPFWLAQALPNYSAIAGAVQAIFVIIDVMVAVLLFLNWSNARRTGEASDPAGRVLLWACGVAIAVSVLSVLQQQLFVDGIIIAYAGRYTVSVLAASSLLFLFAISTRLKPGLRSATVATVALAVLMLAFNIWSIALIHQFYLPLPVSSPG